MKIWLGSLVVAAAALAWMAVPSAARADHGHQGYRHGHHHWGW